MDMEKEVEFENKNQGLKHVAFVRVAAIRALVCFSNLYEYAKQSYGPLRSTVVTVEGVVATVVGPAYEKFKDVPDHLLGFLDKKVDEQVPAAAKQVVSQAQDLVQNAARMTLKLVDEARTNGARRALHYAATEYKQFVLVNSTRLWVKLNRNSAFHSVAAMVVAGAAKLSEKYNCLVKEMSGKGYPVFDFLPLIPAGELEKAVEQAEAEDKRLVDAHKSDSDSDSG